MKHVNEQLIGVALLFAASFVMIESYVWQQEDGLLPSGLSHAARVVSHVPTHLQRATIFPNVMGLRYEDFFAKQTVPIASPAPLSR